MAGDLSGLVNRLEAVTARLEGVASRGGGGDGADAGGFATELLIRVDTATAGSKWDVYRPIAPDVVVGVAVPHMPQKTCTPTSCLTVS